MQEADGKAESTGRKERVGYAGDQADMERMPDSEN